MEEQLSPDRFNSLGLPESNQFHSIPETDSSGMEDSQPFQPQQTDENDVTIGETTSESDNESDSDRVRPSQNDNDFIAETEPSESYNSQPNGSQPEFAADEEINIPATPSESDQDEDDAPATQRDYSTSPANSTEAPIQYSNLSSETNISPIFNNNVSDEHVVGESDGSQMSNNQFVIDTEISIPETPSQSESDQDAESNYSQVVGNSQISPASFLVPLNRLEDDVVRAVANTIEFNDEIRRQPHSPDIFDDDDDIIPNSINVAQSNADTPPAIRSPDIFDDVDDDVNEPNEQQNANEIVSPRVHDDFPFVVPGKSQNQII